MYEYIQQFCGNGVLTRLSKCEYSSTAVGVTVLKLPLFSDVQFVYSDFIQTSIIYRDSVVSVYVSVYERSKRLGTGTDDHDHVGVV